MRGLIYELTIPLGFGASFSVAEKRTIMENETPVKFDLFVEGIIKSGCRYVVFEQPKRVYLEGDPTLES